MEDVAHAFSSLVVREEKREHDASDCCHRAEEGLNFDASLGLVEYRTVLLWN